MTQEKDEMKSRYNYRYLGHSISCVLSILLFGLVSAQSIYQDPATEFRIDSIMDLMTLEEKIGQMTLFTSGWDVTGPVLRENYVADVKAGRAGNLFNAHTVRYNLKLQQMAVNETRLGIPLMFGYDVIHGYKTIFPIPLGEAASWDMEAIERSARVSAIEASASGLNWTFAPMVDICYDPRWGRITEGAGEDPYLGSMIAQARVRGFQGEDLSKENTLYACAKHYAAYGAAKAGRDYHTVDISELTLRDKYLPPFKAAVDAGVRTIMTGFNEYAGVPVSGSKFLLSDVLRDEWGFAGFVVTDYTSISEMVPHGYAKDRKHSGELALTAGVDMDMQAAVYYDHLAASLQEGTVSLDAVNAAVRRILRAKFELGLFDDPYRYLDTVREKELIMCDEHIASALDVARRSIVLLKNEGNTLPLSKDVKTIALIGPLADSKDDMLGSWAGSGDRNDCVTLREGIESKLPDSEVVLHPGAGFDGVETNFNEAVKVASKADIIIAALGEPRWMSGEAASRTEITLPGKQIELLEALAETQIPIVVVLMNGRPLDLSWLDENMTAILETWYLGTQGGHAIADVLFGDYNPSGKLPVTFPRSVGQIPIHYDMKNTGRPFDPNNKYTSKYIDTPNEPLYPFGYGLSYTTFSYSQPVVSATEFRMNDTITVQVDVSNTGQYKGEEVVQLYVRDLVGSVTRPVRELKGFEKINLEPGETRTVTFKLTSNQLKFTNSNLEHVAEPGDFEIHVGTSSSDTESITVTLK